MQDVPKCSMLVPFSGQGEYRNKVWAWLEQHWRAFWPGDTLEIIMGNDTSGVLPWSKAVAVNDAASRATSDIFLITDADSYVAANRLRNCVRILGEWGAPWIIPFDSSPRLSEYDTERILAGDPTKGIDVTQPMRDRALHWTNDATGNIQIVTRETFELLGGYDERFRGWGGDDYAFALAANTMVGRYYRADGECLQFYHPRYHARTGEEGDKKFADRHDLHPTWVGQKGGSHKHLEKRYRHAYRNQTAMKRLIAESLAARSGSSPSGPGRLPKKGRS